MKRLILVALVALCCTRCAPVAFADVTVKSTGAGKGMGMGGTMTTTTYIKGNKMRTETVMGDTTRIMIFDVDAQKPLLLRLEEEGSRRVGHAGVRRQYPVERRHLGHEGLDQAERPDQAARRQGGERLRHGAVDAGDDGRQGRHEDDGHPHRPDLDREGRAGHRRNT